MTASPIISPAPFIATYAVAFSNQNNAAINVSAATPLPVAITNSQPMLVSGNVIATIGGTPTVNVSGTVPVSGTFWPTTQPVSGSVAATLGAGTATIGAISNTAFGATQSGAWSVGLTGTLPAFAATPTVNLGSLNGAALDSSVQAVKTAIGSPFQAGGLIGNTAFGATQSGAWSVGLAGTLPAFAATPTVQPTYSAPAAWGSPTSNWDARAYGSVTIWCWSAPTTPYTINAGDGTNMTGQTAIANTSTGVAATASITAPGRYVIPGNAYVALAGGTGGTFSISAGQ